MHLLISHTNLWILAIGVALAALNAFASSRLGPAVARLFAHKAEPLPRPSRRGI